MPDFDCPKLLSCLLVSVSLLATAFSASAAPQETNIAGITTIEAPPDGFVPLQASAADLRRYGLPARPDPLRAPAAYAAWAHTVGSAKHYVAPRLRQKATQHLPMRRSSRLVQEAAPAATRKTNYVYSDNWSGIADASNVTGFGPYSITTLFGEWVVPFAQQAFGACTGGTDYSAIWMGIDGYNNNDVFQAGTEADATCVNGTNSSDYYVWFEWYPDYSYEITNFYVGPGNVVSGVLVADSSTSGSFYVINETTNVYTIVTFQAPAGTYLAGNSSEWIVELPSVNNVEGTLTNYVADFMANTVAVQNDGTAFLGGNGIKQIPLNVLTMLDSSGNPISQVQSISGSQTTFEDEGSAK